MDTLKLIRLLGLSTVLATAPALFAVIAHAQSTSPTPSASPDQVKPMPPSDNADMDLPKTGAGSTSPSAPSASPSGDTKSPAATASAGKSTAAPTIKDVTVGTAVFGSDGRKIGEVKEIKAEPGGVVEEIHVKTGGVLGFGAKIVAIPGDKIAKGGQAIQIAMTSEEIGKLPVITEKKG